MGLNREGGNRKKKKKKKRECKKVSKGNGSYLLIPGAGTGGVYMIQSIFLCLLHSPFAVDLRFPNSGLLVMSHGL